MEDTVLNKENNKSFRVILEKIIFDVPKRSQEILRGRYGIVGERPKTLEEIGREHKITRERVRQIIKEALKKIKLKGEGEHMDMVKRRIEFTINQNSGIIKAEDILNKLGGSDQQERSTVKFLLECLEGVEAKELENELEGSYFLAGFDLDEWKKIKNEAKKILEEEKTAIHADNLFEKFAKKVDSADKKRFFDFLGSSQEIKQNSFGKWGLAHWNDINPRVAWQRAYVILKETGEPLHFKDITRLIDEHNLNKRKTHPQTIHNELIKNERFVLVGRGVYALTEWGYKRGTVKDVLEDILKGSAKPMGRSEILDRISKIRQVKKSTILINLNNFFEKVEKDKYTLKD